MIQTKLLQLARKSRAQSLRLCPSLLSSYNIREDHSHNLKFLGRHAGRRQIEKLLLAGAVEIDFAQYVSSETLTSACPIKRVYVNQLAANSPIEDRWNMGFTQVDGVVSSCVFTVLDGHSGTACVHTLAWSVLDYVAAAFLDTRKLQAALEHWRTHDVHQPYHFARRLDLLRSCDHRRMGHAAIPPTNQLMDHMRRCLWDYVKDLVERGDRSMDPVHCMTEALLRLDNDLCSMGKKADLIFDPKSTSPMSDSGILSRDLLRIALSGAVGCVGRLFWSNDGQTQQQQSTGESSRPVELHLANVGDCGAVLLRQVDADDKTLQAIPCTTAHQGATNQAEMTRITSAHPENRPTEIFREGGRLLGELAPSRAFGDVRYKWPAKQLLGLSRFLDKSRSGDSKGLLSESNFSLVPHPYTSPPYLSAEPEVTRFQLTPEDRYLVIASDGLWDMLSSDYTAQIMIEEMENPACSATRLLWNCLSSIPPAMARSLSSTASRSRETYWARRQDQLDRKSFDRAFKLLSLPPGLARYYRDDITVMVLELFDRPNEETTTQSSSKPVG